VALGKDGWDANTPKRRRRAAESLYELEMLLREEGLSDFVYDEEKDFFRFKGGRFAFSHRYADLKPLEERSYRA
jgi:hypothetical protein